MVFRIGLNMGEVIFEGRNLYGERVNAVARLEEFASQVEFPFQKLSVRLFQRN